MNPSKLKLRSRWTKRAYGLASTNEWMNCDLFQWLMQMKSIARYWCESHQVLCHSQSEAPPGCRAQDHVLEPPSKQYQRYQGAHSWTTFLLAPQWISDVYGQPEIWEDTSFTLMAHASTSVQGSIKMWREPCTPLSFRVRFSRLGEFWRKTING
jgi:hypothetical protein